MNRTQIYLPQKQIEILRKEAQKKRTTTSEIIRRILREKMERMAEHPQKKSLFDAAKRINAKGMKGPRDLASNLDAYLYGGK